MSTLQEQLARLQRYNLSVRQSDPALAEESRDRGLELEVFTEAPAGAIESGIELESIAMRRERPVLAIKDNDTQLVFIDSADSEIWQARLKKAKPLLDEAIRAVGRIDIAGGQLSWVGTGWLVAENMLVTNRHVAREFATRKGDRFTFMTGLTSEMSARSRSLRSR
jgi:endonuclease G